MYNDLPLSSIPIVTFASFILANLFRVFIPFSIISDREIILVTQGKEGSLWPFKTKKAMRVHGKRIVIRCLWETWFAGAAEDFVISFHDC